MDRNQLINALSSAFAKPEPEKEEIHSTVTTGVAGEKDVLRLITSEDSTRRFELQEKHPEAYCVANFVEELQRCGKSDIDIVARELILKFNKAVEEGNDDKIEEIIQKCKELFFRMRVIDLNSPERALANLIAVDAIKAL